MDRARYAAPRAFEFNDDHYNAVFGHLLLSGVESGAPVERAYEIAEKLTDPANKAVTELRETEYTKATDPKKGSYSLPSSLAKALDIDGDQLTDAALAEYEQNVRRLYVTGGDMQAALDVAGQYARVWGLTNVNGRPELVKYPLEGARQDPVAVRADIAALLKQEGIDIDLDLIKLRPVRNTEYSKGFVWGLSAPDEYGMEDNIRGSRNQPLDYALPTNSQEFAQQVASRQDYLLQQAAVRKAAALRYTEQWLDSLEAAQDQPIAKR